MKNKKDTLYVLKYALTQGVEVAEIEEGINSYMVKVQPLRLSAWNTTFDTSTREAAYTRKEAILKLEQMKISKIASLKRQLVKAKQFDPKKAVRNAEKNFKLLDS